MNIYQLFHDKQNTKEYPPLVFNKHDKEKFKELNDKGYGIYFAVNDFNEHRRENDLKTLRYVYADIDIAKNGDKQTREEKELSKERKIFDLLEYCPPTKIIDTSNGIQPLWKIKGGLKPTEDNIKRYKKVLLGIIKCFEADEGAKDVARVLRMPGYYHQKAEPYLCKLIHDYPKIEYTFEELEEKFPYEEPKPKPVVRNNNTQIDSLDFKEVVKRCFKEKGVSISFSNNDNLCLSGAENDPTSAYIDRKNHCYLHDGDSTRLKDMGLAFSGNAVTLPADMLFNGNKAEAFKWLRKEFNLLDEDIQRQLNKIEELPTEKEESTKRYTWGTRELDINFALIKPTNFIVLGSKRSQGKTTYAFDMALKNAGLGHKTMFVSLEMDTDDILDDFSRKYSGITIEEEFDKKIPEIKQLAYKRKKKELKETPNLILKGIRGVESITWKLIEAVIKKEPEVDMVFVDNLDLINSENEMDNDLERQKKIVKGILRFTNNNKIPVILIHHYRKTSGKSHGMDELSGSGKIADGADRIVRITRNDEPNAEYPEKYRSLIYLQKGRGYPEYITNIYFIKGTFMDEPPEESIEDAINLIK